MNLRRARHAMRAAKRRGLPRPGRSDIQRVSAKPTSGEFRSNRGHLTYRFSVKACAVFLTATVASAPPRSHPDRDSLDPAAAVAKICCANGYRVTAFALRNVLSSLHEYAFAFLARHSHQRVPLP